MALIQVKSSNPYWSFDIFVLEQFLKEANTKLQNWRDSGKGLKNPQHLQEFLSAITLHLNADNCAQENQLSHYVEVNGRIKTLSFNMAPNKENVTNYLSMKCQENDYPLFCVANGTFKMKPEIVEQFQSLNDFKKYVAQPEGPFNDASDIKVTQTIYMAGNNTWEETYQAKQIFTDEFMENFVNTFFDVKKKNDSARAR